MTAARNPTCACGATARYWRFSRGPVRVACDACAHAAPNSVILRQMDGARSAQQRSSPLAVLAFKKFVLVGRIVREAALCEWILWLENHPEECMIARTIVAPGIVVRTDFIGMATCLFDTGVSGGVLDGEQTRYRTMDEAEAGHLAVVERVRAALAEQVSGA
jgi:hypothetical protein